MASTVNPNLVVSISVKIREYGCGTSSTKIYDLEYTFADDRKGSRRDVSRKLVISSLTKFGASPEVVRRVVNGSGTLNRDPHTMEVTPNERTAANWAKTR